MINFWSPLLGGLLFLLIGCTNYPKWNNLPPSNQLIILQKKQQQIAHQIDSQSKTRNHFQINKKSISKKTKSFHSNLENKTNSKIFFFQNVTFPCSMLFTKNNVLDSKNKKILLSCSQIALKEKAYGIILRPITPNPSKKLLAQIQYILKKNHILHISIKPEKSYYFHKKNTKQDSSKIIIDLNFQQ